jgi:hypothetical protein
VGAAGVNDISQGAELLAASEDLEVLSALIDGMSVEDLEEGMDLAAISGQMAVAAEVMAELDMPIMAWFLEDRADWLREIAVDNLFRYGATRALSDAMAETGLQVAGLGADEVEEGVARMAASDGMAAVSAEWAEAGARKAVEGLAEMAAAEGMRDASLALAEEGIAQVAEGAADLGASETLHATAEWIEDQADAPDEEQAEED